MLNNYIALINERLHSLDLEIRSLRDQRNRTVTYAVVNTTSDHMVQVATRHSADELAYFRRLLDAMFETNNTRRAEVCAVSSNTAMRLHKPPKDASPTEEGGQQGAVAGALTMQHAQHALDDFRAAGWLEYDPDPARWYVLGPRALMELSTYLVETYNDPEPAEDESVISEDPPRIRIHFCHACREIVTVGQRCNDLDCGVRLHEPCATQFFRVHRDHACPECAKEWMGNEKVGYEAVGKLRARIRKSGAGTLGTRTPRTPRDGTVEEEEEEEDAEGEDNFNGNSVMGSTATPASARRRGLRSTQDLDAGREDDN